MLTESLAGMVQRPGRSVLTMLGTVLGVGAFVAVLGLTSTATGQIGASFSTLQASTVTVDDAPSTDGQGAMDFPPDADQKVERLNGVTAAGVWSTAPLHHPVIADRPVPPTANTDRNGIDIAIRNAVALKATV
jgi:putative ABC transport system permease protein